MSSTTRFIMSSFARSMRSPYHMSPVISSDTEVFRHQNIISQYSGYRYLSSFTRSKKYDSHRRNFSVYNSTPGAPLPSQPPSSSPSSWILGIVFTIILPFAGNKEGPLLQFKKEVDTAVETIEEIVDVVEKVAEVVDKVAEGISDDLPEGGKLKKAVDLVEDMAEETAKDAHVVGDAIDKFHEVEEKVETFLEASVIKETWQRLGIDQSNA